jgi:hypothetical protein
MAKTSSRAAQKTATGTDTELVAFMAAAVAVRARVLAGATALVAASVSSGVLAKTALLAAFRTPTVLKSRP